MNAILSCLIVLIGVSSSCAYLREEDFGEKLVALAKSLHNKCVPITGISETVIDDLRNGNFVEDEKAKVSDKFEINAGLFKQLLPVKIRDGHNIFTNCIKKAKDIDAPELYEKTWTVAKCIQKANPDEFLMF